MTEQAEVKIKGTMDDLEQDVSDRIYAGIQAAANSTERGAQAAAFRVGVSDLGYCSERLRRMLNKETPEDPDTLLAWIGTALGDALEDAICLAFPGAVKQAEVTLSLKGDRRIYNVVGHPDIILPDEGILLDGKTSFGLQLARRMGPDRQKQFQRHGYAKAAWEMGYFGSRALEDVMVGNVWLDRSGRAKQVHVDLEPFNPDVIFEATHWLEEVVLAYEQEREAEKEPPREVCETTCGFFRVCRAYDTDVTGLLTDPRTLAAVDLYLQGKTASKFGEDSKAEAGAALEGISGSTGKHTVRWIHVNGTETRAAYSRLDIREIK